MNPVKGQCYKNSYDYLIKNSTKQNIKLVHLIAKGLGKIDGIDFGHAWVEYDIEYEDGLVRMAYDVLNDMEVAAIDLKVLGRVSYSVEYSLPEALKLIIETENYGPWDDKIKKVSHNQN